MTKKVYSGCCFAYTGSPERDADERRKFRETGWEPERLVFFRLQGVDRQYAEIHDDDFDRYEEPTYVYGSGCEEENSPVRVDLDYGGDLVRGAVRFGRAVEQMTDDAPTRDGTTIALHIDSKRRKKLRQKKTALGPAEDDHEEWTCLLYTSSAGRVPAPRREARVAAVCGFAPRLRVCARRSRKSPRCANVRARCV